MREKKRRLMLKQCFDEPQQSLKAEKYCKHKTVTYGFCLWTQSTDSYYESAKMMSLLFVFMSLLRRGIPQRR